MVFEGGGVWEMGKAQLSGGSWVGWAWVVLEGREEIGSGALGGLLLTGETEGTGAFMNPEAVRLTLPLFSSAPQDSLSLRSS